MRLQMPLFAVILLAFQIAAQSQVVDDVASDSAVLSVHPHHRQAQREQTSVPDAPPPYETPASLACLYRLVSTTVTGCPVLGTTAVPTGGSGVIVIISAFDNPPALADLNVFSQRFGLPECNASNPCFQRVFATGVRPPIDGLWAQGASEVTEYAHAIAPKAQIILVEAASSAVGDVWFAVAKGNLILTNHGGGQMILPFGVLEGASETGLDRLFTTPGVVYLSGNEGSLGLFDYPCASPNVICLGGTGLVRDKTTGNFEGEMASSFWTGGQSVYESRPSYQDGVVDKVGTQRGLPDLAFASDPITGAVLFYTSVDLDGFVGWLYEGNVGIGEAAWAGIINLAGSHSASTQDELAMLYNDLGDTEALRDITKGKGIGKSARPGWDFMTGVGVPVGFKGK